MQAFPGTRGTDIANADNPVDAYWNRPPAFPLTDAGRRAIEDFDGASSDNPRLRCEPTNILFDWTFEADVNRITQQDDRITLLYGSMGLERTIHLDLAEHPADLEPGVAGHSIGRWEGDVLVAETVGFTPGILSADARIPHSDRLRVVERFTLDPDRGALVRSYVGEDPLYLQKPYSGTDTVYLADVPYEPITCDDQSYRSDVTPTQPTSSPWTPWIPAAAAVALIILAAVWLRRRRQAVISSQ
jgi:MYXO-CTERM domain-containing protein